MTTKSNLIRKLINRTAKERDKQERSIELAKLVNENAVPKFIFGEGWPKSCFGQMRFEVDDILDDVNRIHEAYPPVPQVLLKNSSFTTFVPEGYELECAIGQSDDVERTLINPVTYTFTPEVHRRFPHKTLSTECEVKWWTKFDDKLVQIKVKVSHGRTDYIPDHDMKGENIVKRRWKLRPDTDLFVYWQEVRWDSCDAQVPPEITVYWERGSDDR